MNWDALGAVSEFVSAIAIVVTLIFLIAQLRHNSKLVRNSTIQDSRHAFNAILGGLVNDTELFDIYHRGVRDQLEASSKERQRYDILMLQMFRMIEAEYQQYQEGTSSKDHWEGNVRILKSMFQAPGIRSSWARQNSQLSEDFTEEVNSWASK